MLNDNLQAASAFLSVFEQKSFTKTEIIDRINNDTTTEEISTMLLNFSREGKIITEEFFSHVITKTDPEKRVKLIKSCLTNQSINENSINKLDLDLLTETKSDDLVKSSYKKFVKHIEEILAKKEKAPTNKPCAPFRVDLSKIPKIVDL